MHALTWSIALCDFWSDQRRPVERRRLSGRRVLQRRADSHAAVFGFDPREGPRGTHRIPETPAAGALAV